MREMYCQARSSTGRGGVFCLCVVAWGVLLFVVVVIIIFSSFVPLFDVLSLRAAPGTGHSKSLSGAGMPARRMFGRDPCARVSIRK
ncbi:hypothetical protein [Verrucomicrobium sp. BvORR106]|uniref:hypothetical protein n=1 Tax=Verrucomicrobium sp. BvORR106 TaxID=1403819 RepID=UPI00056FCEFD|nr:hypothetical protein [Verrucomicrobium sp. BvORR106]